MKEVPSISFTVASCQLVLGGNGAKTKKYLSPKFNIELFGPHKELNKIQRIRSTRGDADKKK